MCHRNGSFCAGMVGFPLGNQVAARPSDSNRFESLALCRLPLNVALLRFAPAPCPASKIARCSGRIPSFHWDKTGGPRTVCYEVLGSHFLQSARRTFVRISSARRASSYAMIPSGFFIAQNSAFRVVRGKGSTSRMLPTPVRYMIRRSKPMPKPECGTEPYLRSSRYHQ